MFHGKYPYFAIVYYYTSTTKQGKQDIYLYKNKGLYLSGHYKR